MAKSAILSIRIVSNSTDAAKGIDRTERSLGKLGKTSARETVSLQRMNQQLDQMSSTALKIGSLGAAAMSATSRVAALGQAIAPIAGFAAVLPGALGATAAGVATFKVATSGLADALKASTKGTAEFEEATKDMAPAMRGVARAMVEVNEQFSPTRRAVQEAFWTGTAVHVKRLASAYLPQVNAGMVGTAKAMNRLTRELATGAEQGAKFGAIEKSFAAVQRVVDSLAPAMAPLARGFSQILAASADLIPAFHGANTVGQRFEQWAQRISTDGSLQRWLAGAVDVARDLGVVFKEAGRLVGGVMKAAADATGGNALKSLKDNLTKIADAVNRPEIQEKLRNAFERANKIVGKTTDLFVKLLPFLVDAAPLIMAMAGAWKVFAGASALWKGAKMIRDMEGFGKALSGVGGALKGFASGPVGWVILAVVAIGAAFVYAYKNSETFRNVVDNAVRVVGQKLTELGDWLKDTFGPIWDEIKNTAAEWGPKLWQAAQDAWGKMQEVWGWLQDTFAPVWAQLSEAAASWGRNVINAIKWAWDTARELWSWIKDNLGPVWDEVKGPLLGFVKSAVSGLAQVLYGAYGVVKFLGDNFGPVWTVIQWVASYAIDRIKGNLSGLGVAITIAVRIAEGLKRAFDNVRWAGEAIGRAVSGSMGWVIGSIQTAIGWAGRLRWALSNMPGPVGTVARLFGSGMWAKPAVPFTLPEVGKPFYMTAASLSYSGPSPASLPTRTGGGNIYNTHINIETLNPSEAGRAVRQVLRRDARRDGLVTAGAGKLW